MSDTPDIEIVVMRIQNERFKKALEFIRDLSQECLARDVQVGTAAEIAVRHIYRRSNETLG